MSQDTATYTTDALVIEVDGRILLSVDGDGQRHFADDYDAERVIEEMTLFGMERLGSLPEGEHSRTGWYITATKAHT